MEDQHITPGTPGSHSIRIPVIPDPRGNLSFVEGGVALPFEIARAYWIYDVPADKVRHGRALRHTNEMVVALSGAFDVVTDDGKGNVTRHRLDRGYKALVIEAGTWREIDNFSSNSVALVLADRPYDEDEYIRCHDTFVAWVSESHEQGTPFASHRDDAVTVDPHPTSSLDQCGIVRLNRHMHPNGSLTVVDNADTAMPFDVRRVFYLYDVPADSERGGHSHYEAQELIVAVAGSFDVVLDDGQRQQRYTLNRPYQALYIPTGIWRTLDNFSSCSVCLVLTSRKYSEADYVREYSRFIELCNNKQPQ